MTAYSKKYLDKKSDIYVFDEIILLFKIKDLEELGIDKATKLLMEADIWKKRNNNYDTRLDNRPASQGGPQLHIRNRRRTEWAYRATVAEVKKADIRPHPEKCKGNSSESILFRSRCPN